MASTGKIASQNRGANPAPAPAAWTKQAIAVVGDADTQNIAVVGKHCRLAGKSNGRIAAVGRHIDEWHTPSYTCRYRTKIEIHGPIGIGAHIHGGCVQSGYSKGEITFEWLVEKRASIEHCGVKTH